MNTSEKKTILVVDDIPINIKLIQALLGKEPYEVLPAYTGAEALKLAKEQKPDAILLDIMMPDMDGLKVLSHLKADPETKDINVIMQSAISDELSMQKAKELGALDYLCKPILVEPLVDLLNRI